MTMQGKIKKLGQLDFTKIVLLEDRQMHEIRSPFDQGIEIL